MNSFVIKKCNPKHIDSIMDIQNEVLQEIKNTPYLLYENKKDFILQLMDYPNVVLGAFVNEELIAFAALNIPHNTGTQNLCSEMNIPANEMQYVGNTKLVIVKKEYRGNHLQQILFSKLEEFAKEIGMKHLYTTVSPDNIHSKQNIEALKYTLHHIMDNYNGLTRCVYYKKL